MYTEVCHLKIAILLHVIEQCILQNLAHRMSQTGRDPPIRIESNSVLLAGLSESKPCD